MTILLAGFEPFGGEVVNPSWEAVRKLDNLIVPGGERVVTLRLPVVFGESLQVIYKALAEVKPSAVLIVGQAGGATHLCVERVAINIDDARIGDNKGQVPVDRPIVKDGPAAYFATLPVKQMVSALQKAGIPTAVSNSAGTFICNHVMYGVLHITRGFDTQAGFLHIPFSPPQVTSCRGSPSMPVDMVVEALKIILEVIVSCRTKPNSPHQKKKSDCETKIISHPPISHENDSDHATDSDLSLIPDQMGVAEEPQ
eukprot:Protomagalhaensia_wolfi_Nauph_80__287@NODE_115_length_3600_cov_79_402977_g88_i0_p3_GENE_NODE_115_length_3600_cov_79_402977_g88_i0NODE_115_length_3600_cov_79_402977_g88_i0_p3_ORF_typecomplete_len255_score29_11Peptidase_C15/PF01470_17/3_7e55_NODE_115_length_3600_cov_79_402977_g88_i017912555